MEEIWKRLIYNGEDYGEFYLVSNLGRIKDVKKGCIKKNYVCKNNPYYRVTLSFGSEKERKIIKVHRAVAQAFIPNPNNLPQVNHKDGNKLNNNVNNLEWVTAKQNNIHAVMNKLSRSGENSELSKLTNEQILYIRENCILYDKEFGCTALANKFGVDISTISNIIHSKSWKDYSDDYELIDNSIYYTHKNKTYVYQCKMCEKKFNTIYKNRKYCSHECFAISQRKTDRPSKEELFELIKTTSFIQIGEIYGVSDNAIRKWCKQYDLPYKKKDIQLLLN